MALYKDIGLDFMMVWPYDEGGCGCDDDWPWGGKGYPRLASKMQRMATELYPNIWALISTWLFDKPVVNASEYAGLDQGSSFTSENRLAAGDSSMITAQ